MDWASLFDFGFWPNLGAEGRAILIVVLGALPLVYILSILILMGLRHVLWALHYPFRLIDELMWFLYNPVRAFMHNRRSWYNRPINRIVTYTLIKPIWQLVVWYFTTPLRLLTGLYFDVLLYLTLMAGDSLQELVDPKNPFMRRKRNLAYGFFWLLLLPWRMIKFTFANILAILDSLFMLIISVAWPTFTMFHGTRDTAATSIQQGGRWLVGSGNYAGSGIYFGRSVKVAKSYAASGRNLSYDQEGKRYSPIIMARVTLTMLRSAGVTRPGMRNKFADGSGHGGRVLAEKINFPFYATEFWRKDHGWWEYCLLQGGKDGQMVRSWRIRPVGYAKIVLEHDDIGELQRLWEGRSHYCLRPMNILMVLLSLPVALGLLVASVTVNFVSVSNLVLGMI